MGYRNIERILISECAFGDDLVVGKIFNKFLDIWKKTLQIRNLKINVEKTKIMSIGLENKTKQKNKYSLMKDKYSKWIHLNIFEHLRMIKQFYINKVCKYTNYNPNLVFSFLIAAYPTIILLYPCFFFHLTKPNILLFFF